VRSLLDLLGLADRTPAGDAGTAETATVRKIARELEELEPERARFLAAFAYLLSRVAHADLEISDEETRSMEEIVRGYGDLPDAQAVLVVEIAKSQSRLFGHTENFQVAREFKKLADREQCLELLHCLFAVSAADDVISGVDLTAEPDDVADILIDLARRETKTFSVQFARTVAGEMKSVARLNKHPLRSAGFRVLKAPDVPSILVETAFISNPQEEGRLKDERYQDKMARAILGGIKRYFSMHPPRPQGPLAQK